MATKKTTTKKVKATVSTPAKKTKKYYCFSCNNSIKKLTAKKPHLCPICGQASVEEVNN